MSLSLTTLIVTFKSDKIIEKTLKSVPKNSQIILIENSNNKNFKKNMKKNIKINFFIVYSFHSFSISWAFVPSK